MALGQGLPVSRYVNVSVNLTPLPAAAPAINTCLLLGTSMVIDTATRMRPYPNIAAVAVDFATIDEEYLGAQVWFAQNPTPSLLYIGRWCKTAASGQLICGAMSAAEQALGNWTSITGGAFSVTVDGTLQHVSGLNFAAVTNLNGVASIITTALAGTSTCVWDANYERFEFTSHSSGPSSSVSFLSSPTSGTDISVMLRGTLSCFAYEAIGLAAETALAAVTLLDSMFSSVWYALVVPSALDADHQAIGAYCEAAQPPHYYGVTTAEAGALNTGDTTSIGALLAAAKLKKTACQYSSTSPYAILSYLARILTTRWSGQNTTINLMYKAEPSITAETLNTTQANALRANNYNVCAIVINGTAIIQDGTSASGDYTDTVIGADAWAADLQTTLYNVLYTLPKVPQTDAGMTLLANACDASSERFVANGYLGPGQWNSAGFGTLNDGDFLAKGYYVFIPPIATQAESDRAARRSPLIQIAGKNAGAVDYVDVLLTVNQ